MNKFSVTTSKPFSPPQPTGYFHEPSGSYYWRAGYDTWMYFNPDAGCCGAAASTNDYKNDAFTPIYDDIVITISSK